MVTLPSDVALPHQFSMNFAIATNDGYQCVLEAFLGAGWDLQKLFVSPESWMSSNKQVIARALELGANVQHSPITSYDLTDLGQRGCATLIIAAYDWKIPGWRPDLKYAVNFHPSPLPEGRGPYPLVRAILEGRSSWAVTCHLLNERFDEGDILDAEYFDIDSDECHESLRLKTQMAAGRLAGRVVKEFEVLCNSTKPQGPGSYWVRWSEQDRTIDFTQPIEVIMRQIRAFGDLECVATINEAKVYIHRAKGWHAFHSARTGAVVHASNLALVVAAGDGFIAITEWSFNPPGAVAAKLRCGN